LGYNTEKEQIMNIQVGQQCRNAFGQTFTVTKVETTVTGFFHEDPYRITSTIYFTNSVGEEFHLDCIGFMTHYRY
jgi:hypothetical protein